MLNLNFEALERGFIPGPEASEQSNQGEGLTPELLGRVIAWAYRLYNSDEEFGRTDEMFSFLVTDASEMPKSISDIVHIERRIDGEYVAEVTRLMAGAQASLSVGRLNPDTYTPVFKIDPVQASHLLGLYECKFPDEVRWVKSCMRSHSRRSEDARA